MTVQQKRAAATISFGIVVLGATLLAILAVQVGTSTGPLGDRFVGRDFMLLINTRGALEKLLAALPAILSLGLSIVARARLKDWQYYSTVAVTVIGVATCVYLVMELGDGDQAKRLWQHSPVQNTIDSFTAFTAAAQPFIVAVGAWFVGVLGIQLGMNASSNSDADNTTKPQANPRQDDVP